MTTLDIKQRLERARDEAGASLGVEPEIMAAIALAAPPNPEMGDIGFPCFSLARALRRAPVQIAGELAAAIADSLGPEDVIEAATATGPYVNFRYRRSVLASTVVGAALEQRAFGRVEAAGARWMIEYSAPNTNKPQHLGHVRNDLLGESIARILEFAGSAVLRVNLINDRGIHICKSMLAYQRWGDGETPEATGEKGDHFVGRFYVLFETKFREEYAEWLESAAASEAFDEWAKDRDDAGREAFAKAYRDQYFNGPSALGREAREMLRAWEAGDSEVVGLWQTMNAWVFAGFEQTYERLGVRFDHVYLESETYLMGKDIVSAGVESGLFETLEDGAVACDLEAVGLAAGRKILQRRDGTSVYMTQDLGTALSRFDAHEIDGLAYVVGDEQNHHFRVLFAILAALRPELAGKLHHLSYGMVELPEGFGKMKSREGTVIDADDLMDEMESLSRRKVAERFPDLEPAELELRARAIGLAALKFYILDFNPKTTVTFHPEQSIRFEGRTGPYCLYSYARVNSIRKKSGEPTGERAAALAALGTELETAVVQELMAWPEAAAAAARLLDPSKITEQLFNICKAFSTLYNDDDHKIIDLADGPRRDGLLYLAEAVASTLRTGLDLLGIDVLERM